VSRQRSQQPLCRLSQAETRPQIYRQRRNDQSSNEAPTDRSRALPSFCQCPEQHDQEHRERKHLERKARQQDVVRCSRVLLVGVGDTDQSSSRYLNECRRDVANDEDPEDKLRRHRRVFSPVDADHDGDERVDGCGEEDRGDDDEEVLLPSARCSHSSVEQKNLTWTTNHGTEYGFCWLESMRKAYPTISIAVPTTTVLKYQVRWRRSKNRCAASPMANRTTPRTPTTREGVYLMAMSVFWSLRHRACRNSPIYDDRSTRFGHWIGEVRVDIALNDSCFCHDEVPCRRSETVGCLSAIKLYSAPQWEHTTVLYSRSTMLGGSTPLSPHCNRPCTIRALPVWV
jgi:hypothetical protein